MPNIELLECVDKLSNETVIVYSGLARTIFSGSDANPIFRIGKNIELPQSQIVLTFNYDSNANGPSSPYLLIYYNDHLMKVSSFSNTTGAKTIYIDVDDELLSKMSDNISSLGYDHITLSVTNPYGISTSTTKLIDISLSWSTSRSETYENYETKSGSTLAGYSGIDSFPINWNQLTSKRYVFSSLEDDRFLKINFSGIDNDPFDIVSRAIVRVTGSNNLSISGVSERPTKIEAYCVNRNLSETNFEVIDVDETINQEGEIFAWGTSDLINYSGNQSNDIELCFIKEGANDTTINYSAFKLGRDHKSLFSQGDFYLKGINSGYQINNLELFLYTENDKYVPFGTIGGNNLLTNININLPPSGYVFSRKLLKQDIQFWNCSISGSGVEGSGEGIE